MSKLKFLAVALVMVAVASVLLYTPLTEAFRPGEKEEFGVKAAVRFRHRPRLKARLAWRFLNRSEPVEVEGTVVALFRSMLIIDITGEYIRIHLPPAWNVGEEVVTREEYFEGYLSVGEGITVEALRANVIEKEGLCIYLLLGYEIVDEDGVHAYAILPFNIET